MKGNKSGGLAVKIFPGALFICLFIFCATGAAVFADSQENAAKLESAIDYYRSARFDRAIEILTRLGNDESIDIDIRKEALRYLGRCYIAERLTEKAKEAILELLSLEPPMILLDPDKEAPPLMKVYYEARKQKSGGPELERADPGIQTLAIVDFKNRSVDKKGKFDPMEKGFSDIMINRLNGATSLKVVERERLQWLLNEYNIQDKYDAEGAVRAGKLLGVHAVMFGSFIIVDDELWLSARLVKVESSEILMTEEVKGKVDKFFDVTDQLSEKIAERINVELPGEAMGSAEAPNSLEAMMAYSEGLDLLEKNRYQEAYQKFLEALDHDPNYEKARARAESIKFLTTYAKR